MLPTLKKPNTLFLMLLFLPFCKPAGVEMIPWLNTLFSLWKLATLAFLLVILIPKCFVAHPAKKPAGFFGLALFWLILVLGSIRAGAEIVSHLTAALSSLFLLALIRYEVRMQNGKLLLKSLAWLFTGCIVAHILSVILCVVGLTDSGVSGDTVYLFGMDNYSAFVLYPMLTVVLFYHSVRYGRLRLQSWLLLFGLVGVYLLTASMTAAGAGLVLVAMCLLHSNWRKLPKLRGVRWVIGLFVVLLVLICGLEVQTLLAGLLNSMSKGVSLNSRSYIWANALELIAQRPVFGHGGFTQAQIDSYILQGTTHAHNLILEILMRTGIVGSVGYVLFLCGFDGGRKSLKLSNPHRNLLLCGLVAQLILTFMDFYPTVMMFYVFMGILYCSDDIAAQCTTAKKENL